MVRRLYLTESEKATPLLLKINMLRCVMHFEEYVSVAQWIERRPPEASAQVRLLSETFEREFM